MNYYIEMDPESLDHFIKQYKEYGLNADDEETGIQALHRKFSPVSLNICFRFFKNHGIKITDENINKYDDFIKLYHGLILSSGLWFVAHGVSLECVHFDRMMSIIIMRDAHIRTEYTKLIAPRKTRQTREYFCEKWNIGMRQLERILYEK